MPLYEYICRDCHHLTEAIRSIKDADSPLPCDHCHGNNTKRKISLCFAQSSDYSISGSGSGCGNCSGGSCGNCHH